MPACASGSNAQPAPGGGGDTEAKAVKGEERDATSDLLLKHSYATLATYV
jgi:hypothetical protein